MKHCRNTPGSQTIINMMNFEAADYPRLLRPLDAQQSACVAAAAAAAAAAAVVWAAMGQ